MPTVPSSFVPQANLQDGGDVPLQAPGVEPVRNLAADQQVQLGEAMTRAGNVAWNVGSNIQDAIDEAGAKAADVQFLQSTQQLLNGQNGYMNMQGVDAESNFQAVNDAMIQSASGIADGLKNDTQKQMFKQAASRNLLAFQGQVLNHRNKQVQVLAITSAEARTNEYVGLAVNDYNKRNQTADVVVNGVTTKIPVGSFNANVGVAMAEVREIGRLQGFAENSAQMKELERKVWSQVTTGVTNRLMIDGKLQSAMNYVKEQNKAGHLDTKTADSLMSSIDANIDRIAPTEIASNIWSTGVADSQTTGGFQMPMVGTITIPEGGAQNGIYIDAAPDTDVLSPFDGVVELITTTDGVTEIVMKMDDGVMVKMSGLASADMVEAGQRLVTGEVLSTARKEPMRYQAFKNNKPIDPRNLNSQNPNINRENAKPPETVQEARKIATEQIPDLAMRAQAIASITKQHEQKQAYEEEQYKVMFNSVMNGDPSEIDPVIYGLLKPSDQKLVTKKIQGENDLNFQVQLAENPEILTKEWLFANRDFMSRETYTSLTKELNSAEFKNKQSDAKVNADQLNETLYRNGLNDLANPKSGDVAQASASLYLRNSINQQINIEQTRLKRKLSIDEVQEIIDKNIMNRGTKMGMWGGAGDKPIASLKRSEQAELGGDAFVSVQGINIPIADYKSAYNSYVKKHKRDPSDFELMGVFKIMQSKTK